MYDSVTKINKTFEEHGADKDAMVEIDPLHEEWHQQKEERDNAILKKYVEELKADGGLAHVEDEFVEKVLEAVMNKEDLKDADEAFAFFEE